MAKKYLQVSNFAECESLRVSFNADVSLQTMDVEIRADLRLEFEKWFNTWMINAYREGVEVAEIPT